MKSTGEMSIGEIAERFGLATHVLRHWESMGLLSPARAEGRWRVYGEGDVYRVAIILRARDAGLSLERIREMVTAQDPAVRAEVLQGQLSELRARLARIQASIDLLECALSCDHDDFTQCAHFQADLAERVSGIGWSAVQ
ncbi:MerR family transcriptional regulator [Actinopolymorpha pittospori]|uniref:DNA-binding transcriptional MerR regulator n=1 Tax=Actinopolymorpha pittospori TaxID=648752 RepID=A0A927RJC8_9ACTN|nr:MerR family transcriptional regulator [Actinopolymorpha pittospori]MBE1607081.1 DNA-binding transcriptional MerR regulator [Actinopolymorpha pittospori]